MHTLFLLNPAAGKADCTRTLPQQIAAAAAGAGLAPEDYTIRVTTHAGHARELSRAAAAAAQKAGVELRIFTAGGDGTFNEALTGAHGFDKTAVGCLPYGSGNDFLRTYGTKEEFLDLDAQLAGGAVPIDLMRTSLGLSATICAASMRTRNYVNGYDFAELLSSSAACFNSRFNRADISANHNAYESGSDLFASDKNDVSRLYHCVGSFDSCDKTSCFYHSECFLHNSFSPL